MEHLPYPKNVSSPGPGPVPFICKEAYDGGPFLTYPLRRKEPNPLANGNEMVARDFNQVSSQTIAGLEAFIQTWLFFGLLEEIFGDLFDPSQFVRPAASTNETRGVSKTSQRMSNLKSWMALGSPLVLDTSQLVSLLEKWMNRIKVSENSQDEKRMQYEHVASCLRLTFTALQAIRHSLRPDFNPWIRLSIASIGELLTEAVDSAYEIEYGKDNNCPGNWILVGEEPQMFDQMKANGLCPSEIHRLRKPTLKVQTLNFLSWLKKEVPGIRHQDCTERICRANHNNLGHYVAKHRHDICQCTNFFIDITETIRILTRGSLPLLRIMPGSTIEDIQVDVVEASSNLKYIALSHVWADGLGNPYSNSLPKCQLQLLYELSRPFADMENDEDILFWIDTLCCPVEPPEAKAMSLNLMKVPYTNASNVLVLENSLRDLETSDLDPTEMCLRIFTSGWMRRLWTLQEGALPGKLWFQFEDSVRELRPIWLEVMEIYKNEIGRRGLTVDITVFYLRLRTFFHSEKGDPLGPSLESVDRALQHRSVSVASDEPLLIAGLLKLDTASVLDGPEDSRMQRLWSLIPSAPKGIPKNVLFNRGSRLRHLGFRWAPASLLSSTTNRDGSLCSTDIDEYSGSLTPAGLQVHLAALPLRMAAAPKGLPKNPWNMLSNVTENRMFCRYGDGVWLQIWEKYGDAESVNQGQSSLCEILRKASRSYTLLLASAFEFNGSHEKTDALLVHEDDDQDSVRQVISDMIVGISIMPGTGKKFLDLEATYQASRRLLDDEITRRYTDLAIEDGQVQKVHPGYVNLEPILEQKLFELAKGIKDPQIQAVIQTNTLFPVFTARAYLGLYCDLGPMLPKTSEWCVD